ncbi:hypothetical protein BBJ28_00009390 [Nothophytophthora sp. Chile5]|nr:hypothetical protein BBJ28_00009390 [Nothophytophthora sp. Chile5]
MAVPSTVARPAKRNGERADGKARDKKRAWWWTGAEGSEEESAVASSETELLNAAVLCAALSATQAEPSVTDKQATALAMRELEMHVRKSPLPHSLQFPVLAFTSNYVLMQSELAVICAVRATKTPDVLEAVMGSAVPLSQPYVHRFGGARVHAPFWKRAQRLDLQDIHHQARQMGKMLLLCGHSIGGSIAQLAFCELVYQCLPTKMRLFLEKRDFEQQKKEEASASGALNGAVGGASDFLLLLRSLSEEERRSLVDKLPQMMAVGFGAPYIGSAELVSFLGPLGMTKRVITLVNEFDCIPSILNVAQSAAMVAKTTERVVTITKATKTLLNLLPVQMQQRFVKLAATAGTGAVPTASSAYLSMSLSILQNTFQKFRDFNLVKDIDYQYSPCGTYIFLTKSGVDYQIYSDPDVIAKTLRKEDDSATSLTGNAILQHLMSAYVDAVARRSNSIQINATMNFYERLGVPRNATERQIRSAYKSLALKWHPDRWSSANPQEKTSAEEIFKLLAESYETLSDTNTRKKYDAHLSDSPSFKEEFVRHGTVNGMTLDEAIATFRDVIDNLSGAVSKVTSRFSTSSSTVVGHPLQHNGAASSVRRGLVPNNHENIFAPDRIRVARTVGIGADQHEQIMFLEPDEIMMGDVAAPSQAAGGSSGANAGLRTISVVGGAVAVGASVALIVNAWSQYSEMSKKRRQAAVVREMPPDCLLLLLEDHRNTQHSDPTQQLLLQADLRQKRKEASSTALAVSGSTATESTAKETFVKGAQRVMVAMQQEQDEAEDELIEEFFDCATEYDNAAMEAMAEEEFFDCVDLMDEVAQHFSNDALDEEKRLKDEVEVGDERAPADKQVTFPPGSTVSTPFGLATVEDWREGVSPSAVVRFASPVFMVGYIQKTDISRGASLAKTATSDVLESKRMKLADRVVMRYSLDTGEAGGTFKSLVAASGDGALDSGIRAAGGVALANGMARTSSVLGGAVAAPLTIASILVDIGKEYYDYRKRYTDRKSLGMLSTTTEQLMMQDFRLKTGEVIASRTAAAAGAGIGAYGVASAMGMWTTAGLAAGPVGIVAATSAAVVGGMLGFFAGSKVYSASTARYFTSQQNAKEHIDRLELGARIMFDEFDPEATGAISTEDFSRLMVKLYGSLGSISESGYERTMAVIQDESFEGPVTWGMFWEWVSIEAARALRELEREETKKLSEPVAGETWWSSYVKYFSYLNTSQAAQQLASSFGGLADPKATMYPSVQAALGLATLEQLDKDKFKEVLTADSGEPAEPEEESLVLKAQVEYLVNSGHLTIGDAFQLREQLASADLELKASARKTILAMHEGLVGVELEQNLVCEGFGFTGGDDMEVPAEEPEQEQKAPAGTPSTPASTSTSTDTARGSPDKQKKKEGFQPDERLDVMCSLMSTPGLQRFLQSQNVLAPGEDEASARHEDLHCLALMAAAPKPSKPAASAEQEEALAAAPATEKRERIGAAQTSTRQEGQPSEQSGAEPAAMTAQQSSDQKRAWWWPSADSSDGATRAVTSSETELLSASVLCAALSATKAEPSSSDRLATDRAARELEMHVRKSPLPHSLQFPVLDFTADYALVESEGAVICVVRATKAGDILQAVAGSAVPLSKPYVHRFGGARVHAPFWKRAQRLDLAAVYQQARQANKMLLLCGHSIGGSIAKLAFCELVYQSLPTSMRLLLEKIDEDQPKADKKDHHKEKHKKKKKKNEFAEWLKKPPGDESRDTAFRNLPVAMAIGFGAPYVGNEALSAFLEPLGVNKRVVTFVNEFDCIPSILNVAHSAAMIAKTTERLVTIAKATKALLNLLPAPMQQRIIDMTKTAGTAAVPSSTSAYLSMSLTMLQKSFDKLREFNIVKAVDYQYAPCGTYIFMTKEKAGFSIYSDPAQIRKALGEDDEEATSGLTGNSILQHMMNAYADAVVRRSRSIQINATMNHYERLGVARNASEREIRSSYRSLALKWHPDRWTQGSLTDQQKETAEDVFKLLAESYEVLSGAEARQAYDVHLNKPLSRRDEFMHYGTVDGMSLDEAISTFSDVVDNFSGALDRVTGHLSSSSSTTVGHPLQHNAGKNSATTVAVSVAVIVSAWSQFSDASRKKRQATAVRDMPGDCLVLLLEDHKMIKQRQNRTPTIELLQQSKERQIKALAIANAAANEEDGDTAGSESRLVKGTNQSLAALEQHEQEEDELIEEFFECSAEDENAAIEAMVEEEFFECVGLIQDVDQHFAKKHEKLRHPHGMPKVVVAFPRGSTVNTPFGLGVIEDWRENTSSAAIRFESSEEPIRYVDKKDITRGASMAHEAASNAVEEKRAELAERVIVSYRLDENTTGDHVKIVALAGAEGAVDTGIRAAGGMALASGVARSGTALGGMVAAPLTVASILVDIGKEFYDYRKKHTERKSLGVLSRTSARLMRREFRLKTGEVMVSRTTAAAGAGLGAYGVASAMALWATASIATGPIGIVAATSAAVVGGVAGFFGGSKVYSLSTASYFKSQKHAKEHIDRLELGARILFEEHDPTGTGEISKEACLTIMQKLYGISGDTSDFAYEATVEAIKDPSFEGPVTWRMFWMWVSTEAARSLQSLERKNSSSSLQGEGERKRDKVRRKLLEAKRKHQEKYDHKHKGINDAETGAASEPVALLEMEKETTEQEIHARAAFTPVLPGEEDSLDDVKAMVEALVHSEHLTTGQAFELYARLDSDDPIEWVSAREIILALHSRLLETEPESEKAMEYEELFPVAKTGSEQNSNDEELFPVAKTGNEQNSNDEELFPVAKSTHEEEDKEAAPALISVNVNAIQIASQAAPPSAPSTLTKLSPKDQSKASSGKLKRWGSKTPQVDPRLDAMCSLMSATGLRRFLETQYIVPGEAEMTRHEDLHCLALASAVPPVSASSCAKKASKELK